MKNGFGEPPWLNHFLLETFTDQLSIIDSCFCFPIILRKCTKYHQLSFLSNKHHLFESYLAAILKNGQQKSAIFLFQLTFLAGRIWLFRQEEAELFALQAQAAKARLQMEEEIEVAKIAKAREVDEWWFVLPNILGVSECQSLKKNRRIFGLVEKWNFVIFWFLNRWEQSQSFFRPYLHQEARLEKQKLEGQNDLKWLTKMADLKRLDATYDTEKKMPEATLRRMGMETATKIAEKLPLKVGPKWFNVANVTVTCHNYGRKAEGKPVIKNPRLTRWSWTMKPKVLEPEMTNRSS